MKIERCTKPAFVVIGKEGSTLDGPGFIQKLWADANAQTRDLVAAILPASGARCPIFPTRLNRGRMTFAKASTLPVWNVSTTRKRLRAG